MKYQNIQFGRFQERPNHFTEKAETEGKPVLHGITQPVIAWYEENKRDLPWRKEISAYRTWISEIMLQQTRVEVVKPYFARFLDMFPDIQTLAQANEEQLLKSWEGLGYYNRVRNIQKAAQTIVEQYGGEFPQDYEKIRELPGIGDYTAGAIGSIAFGIPRPAADGNVFRVLARFLEYDGDIMKQSVRKEMQGMLQEIIPQERPGDFNQAMIEIGAIVCVPNGQPKCEECPLADRCRAREHQTILDYPVKSKAKARREEKRTILIFRDSEGTALQKRPETGLLAGLYELPALEGWVSRKEVIDYCKEIGLLPLRVQKLPDAKHIFSHIEWKMKGYLIQVDELEKSCNRPYIFAGYEEIEKKYPIPSAFQAYRDYLRE
jgi:A/G-specific adenine glycosylase